MAVTVIGVDYDNVDGLQAALSETFKVHRENGNILLNLADAAAARAAGRTDGPKKTDPRPGYVHQAFPKAMHHPDGRTENVNSPVALAAVKDRGFREEPYRVARVAVGDPAAEKAALQAKLAESDGKIASQNDMLQKLMTQVEALVKSNKK